MAASTPRPPRAPRSLRARGAARGTTAPRRPAPKQGRHHHPVLPPLAHPTNTASSSSSSSRTQKTIICTFQVPPARRPPPLPDPHAHTHHRPHRLLAEPLCRWVAAGGSSKGRVAVAMMAAASSPSAAKSGAAKALAATHSSSIPTRLTNEMTTRESSRLRLRPSRRGPLHRTRQCLAAPTTRQPCPSLCRPARPSRPHSLPTDTHLHQHHPVAVVALTSRASPHRQPGAVAVALWRGRGSWRAAVVRTGVVVR
mmetsp:Transcript_26686/g.66380  ORF Transcript_26686/g.66380 Transcript_26686/m.66380 type:complete len:254 (+) Transcript_26686:1066-1827(+)